MSKPPLIKKSSVMSEWIDLPESTETVLSTVDVHDTVAAAALEDFIFREPHAQILRRKTQFRAGKKAVSDAEKCDTPELITSLEQVQAAST